MSYRISPLAAAVATAVMVSATAGAGEFKTIEQPIEGQYIVVLKETAARLAHEQGSAVEVAAVARQLVSQHQLDLIHTYGHALRGFAVRADDKALAQLLVDPRVEYIEEDGLARMSATQNNATWGLDRIDQRNLPLNSTYVDDRTGSGVHAYVIDSGLRTTHNEFSGRVGNGFSAINDGRGVVDCNGHGTHVSGTIGGTTWGVAKSALIHPVRVFGCTGGSPWSTIIAGIDWVRANHVKPAVANMSLGGGGNSSADTATNNLINAGVTVVVAAGNDNSNACNFSPARVRNAITVGATQSNDARSSFSNFGTCVDIFAPGSDIRSAWWTSNTANALLSGTSMASPHVAGVAALYLQGRATATPANVIREVIGKSSINRVGNRGAGSPNHLLFSRLATTSRGAWFRYNNPGVGDHFYTMNWNELNGGGSGGWSYEGVPGYMNFSSATGTRAMHRYNNPGMSNHFYTVNFNTLGNGGNGWTYEGISGYVPTSASSSTTNLYRYFHAGAGDHFYTTSFGELGNGGNGWVFEGVESQIWTQP